jgi:ATP-dependent protease ClpP protease subunit
MLLTSSAWASPDNTERAAAWTQPDVEVHGATIHYRGHLESNAISAVRKLLAGNKQVRQLAIESVGGDINLGIDLGELVRKYGLDVHATGEVCMFSCANYIFIAGRHKVIDPGTVVIWHGSAIQKGFGENIDASAAVARLGRRLNDAELRSLKKATASYMRKIKTRQARFYRRLGVDERLTVFGQDVGRDCSWTIPVLDMNRFGVADVQAPAGYGAAGADWEGKNWKLLRLGDYPEYDRRLGE